MFKYLLKRTATWLAMIVIAVNITYILATFFLDPRSNYQGRRPPLPEERVDAILTPLNLNDKVPLVERWWTWFSGIITRWDWGASPLGVSVNSEISYRIWVSAQLMLLATIISIVLGVAVGVYTASRQYKRADRAWQFISIIMMNTHIVVASLVVVWAAITINDLAGTRLFYVTGSGTMQDSLLGSIADFAQHLILPTISLVVISYAGYHFLQRSMLLDNINADYVRTPAPRD